MEDESSGWNGEEPLDKPQRGQVIRRTIKGSSHGQINIGLQLRDNPVGGVVSTTAFFSEALLCLGSLQPIGRRGLARLVG